MIDVLQIVESENNNMFDAIAVLEQIDNDGATDTLSENETKYIRDFISEVKDATLATTLKSSLTNINGLLWIFAFIPYVIRYYHVKYKTNKILRRRPEIFL